jgi:hypothetical protein
MQDAGPLADQADKEKQDSSMPGEALRCKQSTAKGIVMTRQLAMI